MQSSPSSGARVVLRVGFWASPSPKLDNTRGCFFAVVCFCVRLLSALSVFSGSSSLLNHFLAAFMCFACSASSAVWKDLWNSVAIVVMIVVIIIFIVGGCLAVVVNTVQGSFCPPELNRFSAHSRQAQPFFALFSISLSCGNHDDDDDDDDGATTLLANVATSASFGPNMGAKNGLPFPKQCSFVAVCCGAVLCWFKGLLFPNAAGKEFTLHGRILYSIAC